MKFNKNNTMNEILDMPGMQTYLDVFFPKVLIDCVSETDREKMIEEIEQIVRMPWGGPFIGDAFLLAAERALEMLSHNNYHFIPLWKECDNYMPRNMNNEESVFLMVSNKRWREKKPAVIICPGGGYELLAFETEGVQMAEKMEELGYMAFVLNYRVKPHYYPIPQMDLAIAVKYVKANVERYGVDVHKLMVMGSSAGGHLSASLAVYENETEQMLMDRLWQTNQSLAEKYQGISLKFDSLCLNYPVISFGEDGHKDSFMALTNGVEGLRDKLSIEKHVKNEFPKTFLWACEDDKIVSIINTLKMGEALERLNLPYKMKVFPSGGHGCGTGAGTSAKDWMIEMISYMN